MIKDVNGLNDTLSLRCANFDVHEQKYIKIISDFESDIQSQKQTISSLENTVKETNETNYALTTRCNNAEEDIFKKNKMIVEFEFDIKKYKTECEMEIKKYKNIFDDIEGLTRKNDELKKECDTYEKCKYENYSLIDGYRKNISDLDEEIVKYKNKIEFIENEINNFRNANDELKTECNRLNICKIDGSISIKEFNTMKEMHEMSKKKVFELRQEVQKMQFQRGYVSKI
jgi:chromosome segregation ATPase